MGNSVKMPDPPTPRTPLPGISPPPHLDMSENALENWKCWKLMWQNYAVIVDLDTRDKSFKKSLFLHAIGPAALKVYNAFIFAEGEDKELVSTITQKFDVHIIGETNETYERYIFNKRAQEQGEAVDAYVTTLRTLAQTCNFCDCMHDSIIRDRIVIGVKDNQIRKRLLQERKLSLKGCIDLCRSAEATSSQLKEISGEAAAAVEVHKVKSEEKRKPFAAGTTFKGNRGKTTKGSGQTPQTLCKLCGYDHPMVQGRCPALGRDCNACGEKNHFASRCPSKQKRKVYTVEEEQCDSGTEWISTVRASVNSVEEDVQSSREIFARMYVNREPVNFQVDCGASVNVIPAKYIDKKLKPCSKILQMWNQSEVKPLGTCRVKLHNPKTHKKYSVEFIVVPGNLTPLLGTSAVQQMQLITVNNENFCRVAGVTESQRLEPQSDPMSEYPDVFEGELGTLPGVAHLEVDPTVAPVVLPLRRVPEALKPKLRDELDRMTKLGVIVPVEEPSEWVSQLVICSKKSGGIRICIDPRPLNKALKREHFPLPIMEDILPELAKARVFSKVDLKSGFWHVTLDEESSKLTTFQTPFGRYRWCRLPFGTCVSSEIFQKRLLQALEGLPGVHCIADDVLICGRGETTEEAMKDHDENLRQFLQRCRERGVLLNKDKCELRCPEVPFMGHLVTNEGLKPDPAKIEAIEHMEKPEDVAAVKRFIGFVNYLAKFLPKLSDVVEPLRQLTRNDVEWHWTSAHDNSFQEVKRLATEAPILAYYDPVKELVVQCDASQKGLGAALLQEGRPIAFASRALTETETRYAQIEKETLAIVYALERFNQYTYGRKVDVHSDHKPLEAILQKPLSSTPKRIQGMIIHKVAEI